MAHLILLLGILWVSMHGSYAKNIQSQTSDENNRSNMTIQLLPATLGLPLKERMKLSSEDLASTQNLCVAYTGTGKPNICSMIYNDKNPCPRNKSYKEVPAVNVIEQNNEIIVLDFYCKQVNHTACGAGVPVYDVFGNFDFCGCFPFSRHFQMNPDTCYSLYQQGPCKDNELFINDEETKFGICSEDKCFSLNRNHRNEWRRKGFSEESKSYVPENGNGECVKLILNTSYVKGQLVRILQEIPARVPLIVGGIIAKEKKRETFKYKPDKFDDFAVDLEMTKNSNMTFKI